jgi:hypothetical protein
LQNAPQNGYPDFWPNHLQSLRKGISKSSYDQLTIDFSADNSGLGKQVSAIRRRQAGSRQADRLHTDRLAEWQQSKSDGPKYRLRQTEKQTDRQTTDSQSQTDRHTGRQNKDRQKTDQTDRQAGRRTDRQTYRLRQMDRQTDSGRQTDIQTDRETVRDRQTDRHKDLIGL